ncbi:hypothetical protein [Cryptosporangium minutisporangium]|uniref:hypothetical protein n=1 Tax=Cryptosporangium minutisporangium TaxID=113569 RepID=UPI0031E8505F
MLRASSAAARAAVAAAVTALARGVAGLVSASAHGDDGALHGAAAVGRDRISAPESLARWAAERGTG